MPISRRGLRIGAAALGLAACAPASPTPTPTPGRRQGPDMRMFLRDFSIAGDPAALGGRKVYASFYASRTGAPNLVAVIDGNGTIEHHVINRDMELVNLAPWRDKDKSGCYYFRQVDDGHPSYSAFRRGEYVLTDDEFNETGTVRPLPSSKVGDWPLLAEVHDFVRLGEGHYLIQDYVKVDVDGQPLWALYLQEQKDGKVVFEWLSTDHHELDALVAYDKIGDPGKTGAVDYLHNNSIDVTDDGNILLSLRAVSTVVKVDRKSGDIMWLLGGPANQFDGGDGFEFQHDARLHKGRLTLFDNGRQLSRGLVMDIDEGKRRIGTTMTYELPEHRSQYCGSTRLLDDGKVVVGWGHTRRNEDLMTLFSPDGKALFTMRCPDLSVNTYRMIVA